MSPWGQIIIQFAVSCFIFTQQSRLHSVRLVYSKGITYPTFPANTARLISAVSIWQQSEPKHADLVESGFGKLLVAKIGNKICSIPLLDVAERLEELAGNARRIPHDNGLFVAVALHLCAVTPVVDSYHVITPEELLGVGSPVTGMCPFDTKEDKALDLT